jgi:hypothetical protein
MRLVHTFEKNKRRIQIEVSYDKKEKVVKEVLAVWAISPKVGCVDITSVLGEYFNLDEVIDKIDWAEKAAS